MQFVHIRFILISLTLCGVLAAQGVEPAPMRQLQQGDRALQFAVYGLLDLRSFQGSTISYKRCSSPKTAWRIGLDINLSNTASDGPEEQNLSETKTYYTELTGYDRSEAETYSVREGEDNLSFNLILQWIRYPAARGELQPYWGVGPTVYIYIANDEYESLSTDISADPRISRHERSTYGFGVSGVLGLEWFFRNSMSLAAEYCPYFRADYSTYKRYTKSTSSYLSYDQDGELYYRQTTISESETDLKSSRPDLVIRSQMKLGLSLYF